MITIFLVIFQVAFIILKLLNEIDWSWNKVLIPLYGIFILAILVDPRILPLIPPSIKVALFL